MEPAEDHGSNEIVLSKRQFLTWGAGMGLVPVAGLLGGAVAQTTGGGNQGAPVQQQCLLTPQAVEGPFYIDQKLLRTQIADGQPGEKLQLRFQVVDGNTHCTPAAGVLVSVWHCNAAGYYSGYPTIDPDHSAFDPLDDNGVVSGAPNSATPAPRDARGHAPRNRERNDFAAARRLPTPTAPFRSPRSCRAGILRV